MKGVIQMAAKFHLWKKLLWAVIMGTFSSSPAISQSRPEFHPVHPAIPNAFDPHCLLVENDSDADYLSDLEEIRLGYDETDRDMDSDGTADGLELGRLYRERIEDLPWWDTHGQEPNVIYKIDFSQWGMEQCEICGAAVNMGFIRIVNPLASEDLDVPWIGLHYMEHGSFSYDGSINDGRVNVVALASVLHDAHLVPVANDTDEDYLGDAEESEIGYDAENPDEDGNWVRDGADLSIGMVEIIAGLPEGPLPDQVYRIENYQYGMELCEVCGEEVNMGFVEIHNPMLGTSIPIDYVALHAMEHESFSYDGTVHEGRVDLATLKVVLEGE